MKRWLGEVLYFLAAVTSVALTYASEGEMNQVWVYLWFLVPVALWAVIFLLTKRSFADRGLKGIHYVPVVIGSALTFGQMWYIQYAFAVNLGDIATSSSTSVLTLFFAPAAGLILGGVAYLGLKLILYIKMKRDEL